MYKYKYLFFIMENEDTFLVQASLANTNISHINYTKSIIISQISLWSLVKDVMGLSFHCVMENLVMGLVFDDWNSDLVSWNVSLVNSYLLSLVSAKKNNFKYLNQMYNWSNNSINPLSRNNIQCIYMTIHMK